MSSVQMCTFWVGKNLLGLRLEDVHEIARQQALAKVPLAPSTIAGLMNLRGDIVPAIDARRCLGLPPLAAGHEISNVILRGDVSVSLMVDEIGDIVTFDTADLKPPPEHISGVMRKLVEGVAQFGDHLVLLVSGSSFLALATESLRDVGALT